MIAIVLLVVVFVAMMFVVIVALVKEEDRTGDGRRIPVDSGSGLAAVLAILLAGDGRVTASDAVEATQVGGVCLVVVLWLSGVGGSTRVLMVVSSHPLHTVMARSTVRVIAVTRVGVDVFRSVGQRI